jgi:hypothetical protein
MKECGDHGAQILAGLVGHLRGDQNFSEKNFGWFSRSKISPTLSSVIVQTPIPFDASQSLRIPLVGSSVQADRSFQRAV